MLFGFSRRGGDISTVWSDPSLLLLKSVDTKLVMPADTQDPRNASLPIDPEPWPLTEYDQFLVKLRELGQMAWDDSDSDFDSEPRPKTDPVAEAVAVEKGKARLARLNSNGNVKGKFNNTMKGNKGNGKATCIKGKFKNTIIGKSGNDTGMGKGKYIGNRAYKGL